MVRQGHFFVVLVLLGHLLAVAGIQGQSESSDGVLRGLIPMTGNVRDLKQNMCGMKRNAPSPTPAPTPSTAPETTTTATTSVTPETTTSTMTTTTTTTITSKTVIQESITTFCVVADAPYRYSENLKLTKQVDNMDPACEFVAHLGDIRSARLFDTCIRETYTNASAIMRRSEKPVLMLLGGKHACGTVIWWPCDSHTYPVSCR